VLDEALPIARGAGQRPKAVLDRRQRADGPGEFDEHSPDDRRHVQPREPAATDDREAAEHDKEDERGVGADRQPGEQRVAHRSISAGRALSARRPGIVCRQNSRTSKA